MKRPKNEICSILVIIINIQFEIDKIRVKYSLIIFSNNAIHHYILSSTLVSRGVSSVVGEQMAAILRCKQPATEEGQVCVGETEQKESSRQRKDDYTICAIQFAFECDFTTAITFSLIMQRSKQRSYHSRSQAN